MLQSEVIKKLSTECCMSLGDFDYYQTISTYIQMALSIGVKHFHKLEEEIVVLDMKGVEAGRFKSVNEAAKVLGIHAGSISEVLTGKRHSAGGLMFIKTVDYELVERKRDDILVQDIIPLT